MVKLNYRTRALDITLIEGLDMSRRYANLILSLLSIYVLVVIGCKEQKNKEPVQDNNPKKFYELTFDVKKDEILGCNLPKAASQIRACINFKKGIWEGYLVGEIPEENFRSIVSELNLSQKDDLLEKWPNAFDCKNAEFKEKFWDVTNKEAQHMYYYEHPHEMTMIFAKYENGNLYFKRRTKHRNLADEDGSTVFQKILKNNTSE